MGLPELTAKQTSSSASSASSTLESSSTPEHPSTPAGQAAGLGSLPGVPRSHRRSRAAAQETRGSVPVKVGPCPPLACTSQCYQTTQKAVPAYHGISLWGDPLTASLLHAQAFSYAGISMHRRMESCYQLIMPSAWLFPSTGPCLVLLKVSGRELLTAMFWWGVLG